MVKYTKNEALSCEEIKATERAVVDESIGKLCFKNGVFDIASGELTDYDSLRTLIQVQHNFNKDPSEVVKSKTEDTIKSIFTEEQYPAFMRSLSRALAGHYEDKLWYMCSGDRNSGKGVIQEFCSLLGDYKCTICPPMESSETDQTKYHGQWFAAGCGRARIAFSNETNTTISGKKESHGALNGEIIKKFASGGDTISARLLRENPSDHVFVATMFLCLNTIPKCSSPDAFKTCRVFDMPYIFDDTQKGSAAYRPPDDGLKKWIANTPGVRESFCLLLSKHYGSKIPCPHFCDPTPHVPQPGAMSVLTSKFEKSEGDMVPCSIAQSFFKNTDKSNKVALGKWLKKTWGIENKQVRVADPDVPGKIKQVKHYVGLKLMITTDDLSDTEDLMD